MPIFNLASVMQHGILSNQEVAKLKLSHQSVARQDIQEERSMQKLKSIAVFCGSSMGNNSCYSDAAKKLAEIFVAEKSTLIYGGAKIGLMGVLADTILENGGKVIGVIPQLLADVEIAHTGLTELHIVHSMHERKTVIADMSDGFILFPGGAGSLDEFFEIYTWSQLGLHAKPCGILNINGYFDHLLKFLDHSRAEGFLKKSNRDVILIDSDAKKLLEKFTDYDPPLVKLWLKTPVSP
jgi:uncharacterized protein (TIGR00730 family)